MTANVTAAGSRQARVPGRRLNRLAVALVALLGVVQVAIGVGPRLLPYQVYLVRSGSMAPALPTGSLIVVRPVDAAALAVGDIITANHPQRPTELITHRVVAIEDDGNGQPLLVTKGDANSLPDGWRIPAAGSGWRVWLAVPYAGYLLRLLQSPFLRLGLIVVPAIALSALLLLALWRPVRRPREA